MAVEQVTCEPLGGGDGLQPAMPRRHAATLSALILVLVALFVVRIWLALTALSPGSPDSINAAIVARNLANGRGYTVDFIRYYVVAYPTVSHPEDAFELAYPTLSAGAMRLVGDSVLAVWLPNILLGTFVLPLGTYWVASSRMKSCWAATAAILVASSSLVNTASTQGWNDLLCATFVLGASAVAVSDALDRRPRGNLAAFGLLMGAGAMSKSVTGVVLAPLAAYVVGRVVRKHGLGEGIVCCLVLVAAATLSYSPFLARNLLVHGTLGSPVQSRIVFPGRLAGADDGAGALQTQTEGQGALSAVSIQDYVPPTAARNARQFERQAALHLGALALVAMFFGIVRGFRWAHVLAMVASVLAIWTIFVHHFEPRYFVPIVPLMGIVLAYGCDRLQGLAAGRSIRVRRWFAATVFISAIVLPVALQRDEWRYSIDGIIAERSQARRESVAAVIECVRSQTSPSAVVMCRQAEWISYAAGRQTVVPPERNLEGVLAVARHYDASYFLALGRAGKGAVLGALYEGRAFGPFELVRTTPDRRAYLYRVNLDTDYGEMGRNGGG